MTDIADNSPVPEISATKSKYEELAERLSKRSMISIPENPCDEWGRDPDPDCAEATAAIRELIALVRELEEAVDPVACYCELHTEDTSHRFEVKNVPLTMLSLRRARAAHQKAIEALVGQGNSDQSTVAPKSETGASTSNTQS